MKSVLIIGAGGYGKHITMKLINLGHQVMVVDRDEAKVDDLMEYATNGQIGDCRDKEFLETLGISNFDVCIVTICNDFESSLVTVSNLFELGGEVIVAWADNDTQEKFLKMAGATEVIYPERQLGNWTAIRYSSERIFDYMYLDEEIALFELSVPKDWIGKNLVQLDVRRKHHINIIGVKRDGRVNVNMEPEELFREGDTVLAAGAEREIMKVFRI